MENIRVPRAKFGVVWVAAEAQSAGEAARGVTNWFAGGVVVTCRWLAGTIVTDQTGRRQLPYSPATERSARAYEELIEAEYLAAEGLDLARPDLVEHRPGWCEGIRTRCGGPGGATVPPLHRLPGICRPNLSVVLVDDFAIVRVLVDVGVVGRVSVGEFGAAVLARLLLIDRFTGADLGQGTAGADRVGGLVGAGDADGVLPHRSRFDCSDFAKVDAIDLAVIGPVLVVGGDVSLSDLQVALVVGDGVLDLTAPATTRQALLTYQYLTEAQAAGDCAR